MKTQWKWDAKSTFQFSVLWVEGLSCRHTARPPGANLARGSVFTLLC